MLSFPSLTEYLQTAISLSLVIYYHFYIITARRILSLVVNNIR